MRPVVMRSLSQLLGALALALAAVPGWAQDRERGRLLYETYCQDCHYQQPHRTFTLDELEDVVQHLDAAHYRFGMNQPRR
jgi:cytochrome c2